MLKKLWKDYSFRAHEWICKTNVSSSNEGDQDVFGEYKFDLRPNSYTFIVTSRTNGSQQQR